MNIWEKAVLNAQKGSRKIAVVAAMFSERVRAELAVIRLRIRIGEVERQIKGLHRQIGVTLMDLKNRSELPKTVEQLFKVDEIATASVDLTDRQRELEELKAEIGNVCSEIRTATRETEDTLA